jgi:hypothetical protein
MSKYVDYVEKGIHNFLELLCPSAIMLRSQMNYNTTLKTKCQFKPIVELSNSISLERIKKNNDDKSRDQRNTMVKKTKEDTNIEVKVEETNDECKIVITKKLYSERCKKFLCHCWLVTNIAKQQKTSRRLGSHRFPQAHLHYGFRFTPTTYTITTNDNLV